MNSSRKSSSRKKVKYKAHRRYREPAVVEAPPKPKIKLRPSPKAKQVLKARATVYRKIEKYGTRRYRKDRVRCDRIVNGLLEEHGLMKTSVENYWRLAFTCLLIGT